MSILKTEEEIQEDTRRILNGEDPTADSVNTVSDVPLQFKEWLEDNAKRSARTYSKPYFVTDNEKYIPQKLRDAFGSKLPYPTFAEYEQAMKYNRDHAQFSPEQIKNIKELNAALPVIQGQIMPFGIADSAHPNPNFGIENAKELGYRHNCQTCTMAYELRRRGFNIEAMASPPTGKDIYWMWARRNGVTTTNNFLTADGEAVRYVANIGLKTAAEREKFLIGQTKDVGRYEVCCEWKPNPKTREQSSHVFILERQKNGNLLWYDPQSGEIAEEFRKRYLNNMYRFLGVRRIDDKLINLKVAERLLKSTQ